MKRFIKSSLAIIMTLYISTGISIAATPAELYDDVWKLVNKKFYDPTNNSQEWSKWRYRYEHKLKTVEDAYVAIDTMLASLNDPYTRFLPPKEFSEETQSIKGSLKGIGTQIGIRDGELVIIAPLEDSPAERAGPQNLHQPRVGISQGQCSFWKNGRGGQRGWWPEVHSAPSPGLLSMPRSFSQKRTTSFSC